MDIYLTPFCDVLVDALRTSVIHDYVEGFSVDTLGSCLWLQANMSSTSCSLISLTNPVIYLCLIWIRFLMLSVCGIDGYPEWNHIAWSRFTEIVTSKVVCVLFCLFPPLFSLIYICVCVCMYTYNFIFFLILVAFALLLVKNKFFSLPLWCLYHRLTVEKYKFVMLWKGHWFSTLILKLRWSLMHTTISLLCCRSHCLQDFLLCSS